MHEAEESLKVRFSSNVTATHKATIVSDSYSLLCFLAVDSITVAEESSRFDEIYRKFAI